jgi:Flp pilus assembly protein TadD
MGGVRTLRERRLEAARGYLTLDMPDHALRELDAIADREACAFAWHQLRGEALRQKRDFYQALDAFQEALALEPDDVSVLFGMAWCYKRIDRLNGAIRMMERAYHAAPHQAVVLYNLACYHALAGHKKQALSWLGRALRMDASLRRLLAAERDFDGLRNDPDFRFVCGVNQPSESL